MRPKIVCLCGSTRFKKEFEQATLDESLAGNIVLSVACFTHHDNIELPTDAKLELDILHFYKIDLADEVLIVNPNGYIGDSTRNEIEYAVENKKQIRYLVQP